MPIKKQLHRVLSVPQIIWRYIKESYTELRRVSWPSRQTTTQYTIVVAASSLVAGAVVGGLDFLLTLAFEKIIV